MSSFLQSHFEDIPIRIDSPVEMNEPNSPINLYKGEFSLKNTNKQLDLDGEVVFKWFPRMEVQFSGIITNLLDHYREFEENFDLIIDGKVAGKAEITSNNLSEKAQYAGQVKGFSLGDTSISVSEIAFAVPNMQEYLGDAVKEILPSGGMHLHKARLILEAKPYTVILDRVSNKKGFGEKLNEKGGYLILYAGKITNPKGTISLSELHKWHDRLHHFLYFLNGRRVSPLFYTGMHEGEMLWKDCTPYTNDLYKTVISWSNIIFITELPQLWISFNALWQDESDKDFLITAIHWYVEANSMAGSIEGSIILSQTALELIYNWLIVENQKLVLGKDSDGLSASNKIRLLISQFRIDFAIPSTFCDLIAVSSDLDGPDAFVKIRNALVHGQETKRAELAKIGLRAKYQALQLGIWYVELALLFILKYQGKYRNRTDGNLWRNTGVYVPWVNIPKP